MTYNSNLIKTDGRLHDADARVMSVGNFSGLLFFIFPGSPGQAFNFPGDNYTRLRGLFELGTKFSYFEYQPFCSSSDIAVVWLGSYLGGSLLLEM